MLGGTLNPFHIFQSKRTGASQFGLIFGGKCGQNYSDRLNLVWDDIVGAEFGRDVSQLGTLVNIEKIILRCSAAFKAMFHDQHLASEGIS